MEAEDNLTPSLGDIPAQSVPTPNAGSMGSVLLLQQLWVQRHSEAGHKTGEKADLGLITAPLQSFRKATAIGAQVRQALEIPRCL